MNLLTEEEKEEELTSRCEEDLDGRVLKKVTSGEDGPHLGEMPFAMHVFAILDHLQQMSGFQWLWTFLGCATLKETKVRVVVSRYTASTCYKNSPFKSFKRQTLFFI